MKQFLICFLLVFFWITGAQAQSRTITVSAGQTTRIHVYVAWDPQYCGSVFGIVKVSVKPQYGRLSNRLIDTTIPSGRFGSSGQCYGKPTKGFAIFYAAPNGFRGTDGFALDVSWPAIGKQMTDTYSITVQ
jgi:hypothetical protein